MNARGLFVPLLVLLLLIAAASTSTRPMFARRSSIGILVSETNGEVKIESVTPGSPADAAGLTSGDIMVAGTIKDVGASRLDLTPDYGCSSSKELFTLTDDTHIVRGLRPAVAHDLRAGDRAGVVLRYGSNEAVAVIASAPEES